MNNVITPKINTYYVYFMFSYSVITDYIKYSLIIW